MSLSLRIDADDRIALLGANGNGKSTLIKLLAGRLAPLSGDVAKSNKLRVGYFAQHQTDELDIAATPVIELGRRLPDASDRELRTHLGAFGFSQSRADTPVANLSGGEKARLLFALMTAAKPHLLLLDEPTNHLDMDSREALAHAINSFGGAVIVISHDPHIIKLISDRFWLVDNGCVTSFEGDIADYRQRLLQQREREEPAPKTRTSKPATPAARSLRLSRKDLDKAESLVNKLHATQLSLQRALADPELYNSTSPRLRELQDQLAQVEQNLAIAETKWVKLQEAWEHAAAE